MFYGAESFNKTIEEWDTSKVKYAEEMFIGAITFNPKNASCSLLKIILCINYESYNDSDSDEFVYDDE
jgi:surface protein